MLFRQALLPLHPEADPDRLVAALAQGGRALLAVLQEQGLAPLWHQRLQEQGRLDALSAGTPESLYRARLDAAAKYLAQRAALQRIDALFGSANIAYVALKGAQVRECVYPDPSQRPASDIDLLVAPHDRRQATRILRDAGFAVQIDPGNISHEAVFTDGNVAIDLHWYILRPGRTRTDLTADLLTRRQRVGDFWGLSDEDVLFLMLAHPAFTKYVSSPNLGLVQVADFLLWIQNRRLDWTKVLQQLDGAGLKAAAWTQLGWYRMLAPAVQAAWIENAMQDLAPSRLRRAYLQYWIAHDLPARWLHHPAWIQLGFTLFLHDRTVDAARAVAGWWHSRWNRQQDLRALLGDAPAAAPQAGAMHE